MTNFQSLSLTLLLCIPLFVPVSGDTTTDCRVPADSDILGLGVRLGVYFQLSSTWILQLVRREEAVDTFLPTGFFFVSFFIAVVFSTAKGDFTSPGALIASTWYPILFYVSLFAFDLRGLNKKKQGGRYVLSFTLLSATGGYNVWFWFKGLVQENQTQCMNPRVFFFANLDAKGGVSVVFKILTTSFFVFAMITTIGVVVVVISDNGWDPYEVKNVPGETAISKSVAKETAVLAGEESSHQSGVMARRTEAQIETKDASLSIEIVESRPSSPNIRPGAATALANPDTKELDTENISSSPPTRPTTETTESTLTDAVASCLISNGPTPTESTMIPVSSESVTPTPNDDPEEPDNHNYNIALGAFVFLVAYIVPAELQLRWNHLEGINTVNTTGQIIPLALGSLSLIRSIYLLKDANWVKLKTAKVEKGIKKLERKLTMQNVDEITPAEDV
jgi:hypothetical protein